MPPWPCTNSTRRGERPARASSKLASSRRRPTKLLPPCGVQQIAEVGRHADTSSRSGSGRNRVTPTVRYGRDWTAIDDDLTWRVSASPADPRPLSLHPTRRCTDGTDTRSRRRHVRPVDRDAAGPRRSRGDGRWNVIRPNRRRPRRRGRRGSGPGSTASRSPPEWACATCSNRCTAPRCGTTSTGWRNWTPTPPACRPARWSIAHDKAGEPAVGISNGQLVLVTLIIVATAPVKAAQRLARWAKTTRRPIRSRRST